VLQQILTSVNDLKTAGTTLQDSITQLGVRVEALESKDSSESEYEDAQSDPEDDDDEPLFTAALRKKPSLDARIKKRMKELGLIPGADGDSDDEKHSTKGKSSGRGLTAKDAHKALMAWPQFYIYRGAFRESPKYDDLQLAEFTSGYMDCVTESKKSQACKDQQFEHLKRLMIDAQHYEWQHVRHFHGIFRQEMERGRIDWGEDAKCQELRSLYLVQAAAAKPRAANNTGYRPAYCGPYQTGECKENKPSHENTQGRTVRHICSYCLKEKGWSCYHAAKDCERKAKNSNTELRQ
jgi:hypothetical protein